MHMHVMSAAACKLAQLECALLTQRSGVSVTAGSVGSRYRRNTQQGRLSRSLLLPTSLSTGFLSAVVSTLTQTRRRTVVLMLRRSTCGL